jgi:hypothetical protein
MHKHMGMTNRCLLAESKNDVFWSCQTFLTATVYTCNKMRSDAYLNKQTHQYVQLILHKQSAEYADKGYACELLLMLRRTHHLGQEVNLACSLLQSRPTTSPSS